MKYIFSHWNELKQILQSGRLFIFLDYDGTLAPIVRTPSQAMLSPATAKVLTALAKNKNITLAVVSGRVLSDVRNRVGIKNIIYVGNHGFEIKSPQINFKSSVDQACRKIFEEIKKDLAKKMSIIRGIYIEDKGFTLSVHYRLADKKQIPLIKNIFTQTIAASRAKKILKISAGKKVLEIRFASDCNKGKAVLWLVVRRQVVLRDKSILPIYIGDDLTDEDAFKVLRDKGLTILVGKPRKSYAKYYVRNTQEVRKFLRMLVRLCDKKICRNI